MWPTLRSIARRVAPWLLLVGGIYWIGAGGGAPAEFEVGSTLPDLTLDVSDGSRVVLPPQSAAGPQPVLVLNFWATYCGPCRAEAPIFTALHEASAKDVRVIGISIEGFPQADMLRAARELGMRYPMASADGDLMRKLRLRSVPTTYVIGKDGAIKLSRVGMVTRSELDAAIARAR